MGSAMFWDTEKSEGAYLGLSHLLQPVQHKHPPHPQAVEMEGVDTHLLGPSQQSRVLPPLLRWVLYEGRYKVSIGVSSPQWSGKGWTTFSDYKMVYKRKFLLGERPLLVRGHPRTFYPKGDTHTHTHCWLELATASSSGRPKKTQFLWQVTSVCSKNRWKGKPSQTRRNKISQAWWSQASVYTINGFHYMILVPSFSDTPWLLKLWLIVILAEYKLLGVWTTFAGVNGSIYHRESA